MANLEIRRNAGAPAVARTAPVARTWDPFQMMDNLMRWDPFREMEPLWRMADRDVYMPAFEVKETDSAYVFRADMPGVKEMDLELTLTGDRLTIAGKRESEEQRKGERYYVYERSYGEFTRTFTLPLGVDAQHVTAELKEGVLKLMLPKAPEAQAKKIPVTATQEVNKPAGHA